MKSILSIIFILLISSATGYSQKPEIIPPSPNVASYSKYGDIPINLSTGQLGIRIPLYSLKEGNVTWPVSLNYSYTGYRPAEEAGWVGRGWSLSGGSISRTVRGLRDEELNDGFLYTYPTVKNIVEDQVNNPANQAFLKDVASGSKDAEPDLFTFSFGKYSGKFCFGSDGLLHVSSDQPLKITYEVSSQPLDASFSLVGRSITQWVITTEDGVQYVFNAAEYGWGESAQGSFNFKHARSITAWHISQIIGNKGEKITFSYTSPSDTYKMVQASYAQRRVTPQIPCVADLNYNSLQLNFSAERYLTEIKGDTWRLDFNSTMHNKNINGTTSYYRKLDTINLYDETGPVTEVKAFGFAFSPSNADLLQSFQENDNPPHEFTYIPLTNIGPTRAMDFWGYYNGQAQDNLISYGNVTSNRNPSYPHTVMGALSSISYPTGGWSEFEYELNQASYKQAVISSHTTVTTTNRVFEWTYNGSSLNVNSSNNFSLTTTTPCQIVYSLKDALGNPLTVYPPCQSLPQPASLPPGSYTASNFMNSHCLLAPFNEGDVLTAMVSLTTTQTSYLTNVGGIRVKAMRDYTEGMTLAREKEYTYRRMDLNNVSSGAVSDWPDNHYTVSASSDCFGPYEANVWKSEPINSLAVTPILYAHVQETINDKVTEHYFSGYENGFPDFYGYQLYDATNATGLKWSAVPTLPVG